ncbi:hypothetical protein HMF8227_01603 [Saliniradius amylolyticus]|uniref:Response regulatory domain-containing protein n=1 Tax=Saliniradius amylolyticus TaxID=2183582 RepID=A0A2S2E510_9ALTE|nr:response regulator [Saliniradius amylolyticus]AWL12077.1 hypothetical protein HMF8227_01603 [Saliniradius amylolyticus]
MERSKLKVAIVEDNGMARINLRNHLMDMQFQDIGCFTHGRELRSALKRQHYDILLMDFHLGSNKNGVEVINDLQKQNLLKPSTSLVFVTSDRMPMIVGQIFDVHPEALVLKPYTIRNLEKSLNNCIEMHQVQKPVLRLMDKNDNEGALEALDQMINSETCKAKYRMPLIKLRARLLLKLKRFKQASELYRSVLERSDQIIWAKWGLIQSTHLAGEIEESEAMLKDLLKTNLTSDKASEWLTRINIEKKDYETALEYINRLKEGEMSMSATRLKAQLFMALEEPDEAIDLVERKRNSNREIREHFNELSLDLARIYLAEAEDNPEPTIRKERLQTARFLIGSVGRKGQNPDLDVQRDYMQALAAVVEDDVQKARELLQQEGMLDLDNADLTTLSDAVAAWHGIGDDSTASELLNDLEKRLASLPDENEKTVSGLMALKNERRLGDKKTRAIAFNKKALEYYTQDQFKEAIDLFYQAYILFPDEPAFSLNLLHCMVQAKQAEHKEARIAELFDELKTKKLSSANAKRMQEIQSKIKQYGLLEQTETPEE